jgi:WD40 repeat protein
MAGIKPKRSDAGQFRRVIELHASADGKQFRTLSDNNIVSLWDAGALTPISTQELPNQWKVVSLRPWDGKYAIVFDGWNPQASTLQMSMGKGKLISVDMDTGKKLADIPGKMDFVAFRVHWANDREAMHADGDRMMEENWLRYNYLTGKPAGKPSRLEGGALYAAHGHLCEDAKSIFLARPGDEPATGRVESIDIASGKLSVIGDFKLPAETGSKNGLVPGGKHFYLADPGVFVFDRKTLEKFSAKPIPYRNLLSISFSDDGGRYAIVTANRVYRGPRNEVESMNEIMTSAMRPAGRELEEAAQQSPTTVRVHDTQTGQTLFAFPARTPWANATLSRDGHTVFVCNDDGTIEAWQLPQD